MPLSRPRHRRTMNLTPLIDVVFLLLVFFMLASTFLKFGSVKLETAGAGPLRPDVATVALIHVGANRSFRVDGRPVAGAELGPALDEALAAGKTAAVIVLRKEAATGDLVEAMSRVRRHRFTSVKVVD